MKIRSKFLKFEVYAKSVDLVPIFKRSWNESTTFMCQECSNWQWTNMIPLLQTKTADMYSTYGNFHKCDQALIPLFGQDLGTRLGLGLHPVNTLEVD